MAIKRCADCRRHPFQDAKYGLEMRVMNPISAKTGPGKHRCTVCGRETVAAAAKKVVTESSEPAKKKK